MTSPVTGSESNSTPLEGEKIRDLQHEQGFIHFGLVQSWMIRESYLFIFFINHSLLLGFGILFLQDIHPEGLIFEP